MSSGLIDKISCTGLPFCPPPEKVGGEKVQGLTSDVSHHRSDRRFWDSQSSNALAIKQTATPQEAPAELPRRGNILVSRTKPADHTVYFVFGTSRRPRRHSNRITTHINLGAILPSTVSLLHNKNKTRKMPAPTALKAPSPEAAASIPLPTENEDEEILDVHTDDDTLAETPQPPSAGADDAMQVDDVVDEEGRPRFVPASNTLDAVRIEHRKVPIPPHRMTPLKASWPKIYPPLVEHLKLQCRMNMKSKSVELRTSRSTSDTGAIQKGADFVRAFALGFDVDDAIALLRLDDLYIESKLDPSLYIPTAL